MFPPMEDDAGPSNNPKPMNCPLHCQKLGPPVGHECAQLGWRDLRTNPTWRSQLLSAEDPQAMRGSVLVDALDVGVLDQIAEDHPEDWSES